jgi:hypothetical protein
MSKVLTILCMLVFLSETAAAQQNKIYACMAETQRVSSFKITKNNQMVFRETEIRGNSWRYSPSSGRDKE